MPKIQESYKNPIKLDVRENIIPTDEECLDYAYLITPSYIKLRSSVESPLHPHMELNWFVFNWPYSVKLDMMCVLMKETFRYNQIRKYPGLVNKFHRNWKPPPPIEKLPDEFKIIIEETPELILYDSDREDDETVLKKYSEHP